MAGNDVAHPVIMLGGHVAVVRTHQGALAGQEVLQRGQFRLQATGQNEQAHHLNQADVLLLDVMQRRMGVEDAQGMLVAGAVVAQHQAELVFVIHLAQDGRDGVVGRTVRLGVDVAAGIGPGAPGVQDAVSLCDEGFLIFAGKLYGGHGPVEDGGLYIRVG